MLDLDERVLYICVKGVYMCSRESVIRIGLSYNILRKGGWEAERDGGSQALM